MQSPLNIVPDCHSMTTVFSHDYNFIFVILVGLN